MKAPWIVVIVVAIGFVVLGVVMPGCGRPNRFATEVRQRAQLHSIDAALELFVMDFGAYPLSDANDSAGGAYCGAMKLCEAMFGQDMLGFHRDSQFLHSGLDEAEGRKLYDLDPTDAAYRDNLTERRGPYLPLDSADVCRMSDIYGGDVGDFSADSRVLCDVYARTLSTGEKVGMPILYYRADPGGTAHDANEPDNPENVYDYRDNQALLELGAPGQPDKKHPMADPKVFYEMTRDEKVGGQSMPRRADTYILISAGWDGLYGTSDDIKNYRE